MWKYRTVKVNSEKFCPFPWNANRLEVKTNTNFFPVKRYFPINYSLGDRTKKPIFRAQINFFKLMSKYRSFPRNLDRLKDKAKNKFFLSWTLFFLEMLIVYEMGQKKNDYLSEINFFKLYQNIIILPEMFIV